MLQSMPDSPPACADVVRGLREIADFLEAHESERLPVFNVFVHAQCAYDHAKARGTLERFAALRDGASEEASYGSVHIRHTFASGARLQLGASIDAVGGRRRRTGGDHDYEPILARHDPVEETAFEQARQAYEQTYARVMRENRQHDNDEQAHHEATLEALEAFAVDYRRRLP